MERFEKSFSSKLHDAFSAELRVSFAQSAELTDSSAQSAELTDSSAQSAEPTDSSAQSAEHYKIDYSKKPDLPLLVIDDKAAKEKVLPKIPQESRVPQVSMAIACTTLALALLRNANGGLMIFGTAGGSIVGGMMANLYDRYLESQKPTDLFPK